MVRPKTGTYLNVFIETSIYERLMVVCDDDGQIKIVAVERALTAYLDECKEKRNCSEPLLIAGQSQHFRQKQRSMLRMR